MSSKKYSDTNLYAILGIENDADENIIRKAYRKKALECHPDKNPDNPKAAELFHELAQALEILTDKAARAAYDNVWRAKKAAEVRNKHLDSKRQKLKADLEKRERECLSKVDIRNAYTVVQKSNEEILQDQIERLRREGSRLLEEEQALIKEQLKKSLADHIQQTVKSTDIFRVKIKWKCEKNDPLNGGYSYNLLLKYLKKYGNVVALVMSKKSGGALAEFKTKESAEMALTYEKGLNENPLYIEWVSPPPEETARKLSTVTSTDYENLVMRKLRQAEERKRLIEQLQKEDP